MRVVAFSWIAAFAAAAIAEEPAARNAAPEQITKLIAQLGSTRFSDREAATRALDAAGEAALEPLKVAAASPDAETRRRASELAERIGRRVATDRLLKPTLVRLDIRDKPLDEAVKELARVTGLPIELPQPGKYAGRRVTFQCEPLPVWQVVEQFCRKADLHDWDGLTPLTGVPGAPAAPGMIQNNVVFGGQGQIMFGGRVGRPSSRLDHRVVLMDGPSRAISAHHAGAIRIRALPPGTPFPIPVMADEILLPLQVSGEQRLQWAGAAALRIDRAIDDRGQLMTATGVVAPTSNEDDMEWVMLPNGGMMMQPAARKHGPIGVRITRPDKSARQIAELHGAVTGAVRVSEQLARIDAPFKSGAVASGSSGVHLKIVSLADETAGEVRLTVEISVPQEVQAAGLGGINGRMQVQGVMIQQAVVVNGRNAGPNLPSGTTEFQGLSVEDAKGRRWTATNGMAESTRIGPQGTTMQLAVTFKAPAGDSQPARLQFHGSRPSSVSIPFTLKNVPLS